MAVFLTAVCLGASTAGAQGVDPFDPPPMTEPVPSPKQDARQALGNVARTVPQAVVMIGGGPGKGHGTGWVMSRQNRLIVTNAHVADIWHRTGTLQVILNGTSYVYTAERVWYHPGVRRRLKGDPYLSARSADPNEGPVDPDSPDVAVVQLAEGGPELPHELAVATPEELAELQAQSVGILGFPGHDTKGWPAPGSKAAATYDEGVVQRLTNFESGVDGPDAEQQFVQYSLKTAGGFSGSPVFLPNGHVVAIHNSGRPLHDPSAVVNAIGHGVRVDCLWELIVHHGLEGEVPFAIDKDKLNVGRWLGADERTERVRQAVQLVQEAEQLVYSERQHAAGFAKCTEALQLVRGFGDAYRVRGDATEYLFLDQEKSLPREELLKLLGQIMQDRQMYAKLSGTVPAFLRFAMANFRLGMYRGDEELLRKTLKLLDELKEKTEIQPRDLADWLCVRGHLLDYLGNKKGALKCYSDAVDLFPNDPVMYERRAAFWQRLGNWEMEQRDRAMAQTLREAAGSLAPYPG
jgi:tetratricopeptide (TPR) repeat protein